MTDVRPREVFADPGGHRRRIFRVSVALLGVLLSPVSWIHHYLVVVVVIGAILADGRSRQRVAIAAGTAVFFALTIPWWGRSLLAEPHVPTLAARVVQDGFGIAAVALVAILARLPAPGSARA